MANVVAPTPPLPPATTIVRGPPAPDVARRDRAHPCSQFVGLIVDDTHALSLNSSLKLNGGGERFPAQRSAAMQTGGGANGFN